VICSLHLKVYPILTKPLKIRETDEIVKGGCKIRQSGGVGQSESIFLPNELLS
jgi:hypothetical protein